MTLLLAESWDVATTAAHYTRAGRWTIATSLQIAASAGRNGNGANATGTLNNRVRQRSFGAGSEHVKYTLGVAGRADLATTYGIGSFHGYPDPFFGSYPLDLDTSGRLVISPLGLQSDVVISANTWHYIEYQYVVGASGSIEARVDGVPVITFSGDTTVSGTISALQGVNVWSSPLARHNIDDVYVTNGADSGVAGRPNDGFLGDIAIECIRPDANGTYSDFAGSDGNSVDNYLLVDETNPIDDDTTYVQSQTDDARDTYNYPNPTGSGGVAAVIVNPHVRRTSTDARTLAALAKLGATIAEGPEVTLADTNYRWASAIMQAKPGGGPWTLADIASAEFGQTTRGGTTSSLARVTSVPVEIISGLAEEAGQAPYWGILNRFA